MRATDGHASQLYISFPLPRLRMSVIHSLPKCSIQQNKLCWLLQHPEKTNCCPPSLASPLNGLTAPSPCLQHYSPAGTLQNAIISVSQTQIIKMKKGQRLLYSL